MKQSVILFDGVCNFCNAAVRLVIKRDKEKRYVFCSLQSERAKEFLKGYYIDSQSLLSFILVEDGKVYTKSTGALRVARHLSGLWRFLYPLIVLPKSIRDIVYTFIANNRYKWFGKREECMIPSKELRARFLD